MAKQRKRFNMNKKPIKPWRVLMPIEWGGSLPPLLFMRHKLRKINCKGLKKPYIVLSNHASFVDFQVNVKATFPNRSHWVISIEEFIGREWLFRLIGGIPKRKFTQGSVMVKHILTAIRKNKKIVTIYPEARFSLAGINEDIGKALGKLVKMADVPVVVLNQDGNFLRSPQWNKHPYRKVPLEATFTCVANQDEVRSLSAEEIQEKIKRGDNPLEFPGLQFTQTADESRALNESNIPSIIISASGMCEVGRIKHHLKHNLWNPNSTILFVGYQAPGTLGSKIVNGEKNVKIFGEDIAVNARIEYIEGYSGHADQEWLLNFIYSFITKPKHIFLVHGEPEGQKILKDKILETIDIPVTIPDYGDNYKLDDKISIESKMDINRRNRYLRLEVIDRLSTLKEELEDMESIIRGDIFDEDKKDEEIAAINDRIKELEQQIVKIIS